MASERTRYTRTELREFEQRIRQDGLPDVPADVAARVRDNLTDMIVNRPKTRGADRAAVRAARILSLIERQFAADVAALGEITHDGQ